MRLALLLASLLAAPAAEVDPPQRQAVIFEPCGELLAQSIAHGALERVASERSFHVERLRPRGDVNAWLSLLADPPAALYVHTVTNREVIAIACFNDRRSRDNALDALAAKSATRDLPVQPWSYATAERRVYVIGFELRAMGERLRDSEAIVYLHREGDPRAPLEAVGFRVSREHDDPQPPINHFLFVKRYFRQWLEDAEGASIDVEPTLPPEADPLPDIELWPAELSVVLPIGEIWLTIRNAGLVAIADLEFLTLLGPDRLQVSSGGRLPTVLDPGDEVDVPLVVETGRRLSDGDYSIPLLFTGRAGAQTYERYGHLEVIVDHPPQITAPSSIEFARGEAVEIRARDVGRRPTHLEAMLPQGVEMHFDGSAGGQLIFSTDEIPGTPKTAVSLVAWAGDDRQRARLGSHEIEIIGGDVAPPPRLTQAAYALVLLYAAYVYLRLRLAERGERRRAERARRAEDD